MAAGTVKRVSSEPLYHVAIADDWVMSANIGEYDVATRGVPYEPGGYVRATTARGLQSVLDTVFGDLSLPLVLLTLDPDALRAQGVRVEEAPPEGARVYAPILRDGGPVVRAVSPLERTAAGWRSPLEQRPSHVVAQPKVLYVGTPPYLVATVNADGTPNLAPASSHWALGRMLCLGIEADGQTALNMAERPDITVNFPSAPLWRALAHLSRLTGRSPVPEAKADRYTYEPDKFGAAKLTAQPSELVSAPRVQECRLQFEAQVRRMTPGLDGSYFMVEAEVLRVHADPALVREGTDEIEPTAWHPLIYAFRHFFERGDEVGWLPSSGMAPHPPALGD